MKEFICLVPNCTKPDLSGYHYIVEHFQKEHKLLIIAPAKPKNHIKCSFCPIVVLNQQALLFHSIKAHPEKFQGYFTTTTEPLSNKSNPK